MKQLDMVGPVGLFLDTPSRDIVLGIDTDVGRVAVGLTNEESLRLGISLIRESGKRYVFQEGTKAPEEVQNDQVTSSANAADPVGGPATTPVAGSSGSRCIRPGDESFTLGCVPRRDQRAGKDYGDGPNGAS